MLTINNTIDGAIQDIEIKGNTVQDPDNLSDIKSVGELQEDGTYKMSILSCGKNLFDEGNIIYGGLINTNNGINVNASWFYTDYIKVKKGNYHLGVYKKPFDNYYCHFYDINKTHIGYGDSVGFAFNGLCTFNQDGYIRLSGMVSSINEAQLEEGTVATEYEPYQENKCDILLPCQLEKVGDVSDRIVCKDGVWGVEKNIGKLPLTSNLGWYSYNSATQSFKMPFTEHQSSYSDSSKLMCNALVSCMGAWEITTEYISSDSQGILVKLGSDKNPTQDLTGLKLYLDTNNVFVLYQRVTPQFIPLPRDTQIQLNSFFGTTHVYMESGEVEGTIKCKIPKSLGATVQSLNNKTDILSDRIEAIEGLKDSQNMKYETDKGYLVCKETKNGVIDDLKIEGKTLVNLYENKDKLFNANYIYSAIEGLDLSLLKTNTVYTLVVLGSDRVTQTSICNSSATQYFYIKKNGKITTFTTPSSFDSFTESIRVYAYPNSSNPFIEGDEQKIKFIILEGDHTQNPPSYFEGLMSVGQDVDKIEVLSSNGNLLNGISMAKNIQQIASGILDTENKTIKFDCSSIQGKEIKTIKYDKGSYTFIFKGYNTGGTHSFSNLKIMYTDGTSNELPNFDSQGFSKIVSDANKTISHIEGNWASIGTLLYYDECYIIKGNRLDYEIQQDKKQILFYNSNGELEPIQELHEWDSIEKHSDNKWYYHKRSGKVVLNGSESWVKDATKTTTQVFKTTLDRAKASKIICDKFPYNLEGDVEKIVGVGGLGRLDLYIAIAINKLSENSITGFKQWLQANNVTVVYQLAEEEVYEIAPLHLDSYANETLILCNSGAISPKMEFSITSHINELVKAYGERINLLEEKVYQYMVTQNRMQLASTYSADSVTFKVDYFSLCGDEENYDEDLYNLILNNILVGKDNYDYDKMFTMILDYASWNQISWEQFDILVGLMDIQHNPPIEELPPEDVIEEDIIENETPVE